MEEREATRGVAGGTVSSKAKWKWQAESVFCLFKIILFKIPEHFRNPKCKRLDFPGTRPGATYSRNCDLMYSLTMTLSSEAYYIYCLMCVKLMCVFPGGLFDTEDDEQELAFRIAVDRINADTSVLSRSRLVAQVEKIAVDDSFRATKKFKPGVPESPCEESPFSKTMPLQKMLRHRPTSFEPINKYCL
ncbi:uncharacterized protein CEXT_593141 [Caerostris extrusa]|uniref:Uncharacterized protein n=1 Tax=Caerostris extrusa TaxID=172846 RepID=A0AAV4P6E5_CAEEX|nr:uncharacterized protein CEXT_593141 [Caerostris extrusa]